MVRLGNYQHYKGKHYELMGIGKLIGDKDKEGLNFLEEGFFTEGKLERADIYEKSPSKFLLDFLSTDIKDIEYAVYKQLYKTEKFEKGTIWIRPLEMFLESVTINGKEVPRFKFIK